MEHANPKANLWRLPAALLLIITMFALKGLLVQPPALEPKPALDTFDTARAFSRLDRILAGVGPHPVDSAASDRVRNRLMQEMRDIGLAPRISDHFTCRSFPDRRAVQCARIRNLLASIGPTSGKHLLLATHYDSSNVGPGASDAGIGVATLLEVGALLRAQPLARPVTLLIDEGEEAGLMGAASFLTHDPLAGRVDSLINLEARGVSGPAIMFETSQPNGSAIAAYARAQTNPVASSLTTDFYRLLPNSTDVTVFAPRGWTTLNFAIIGNESRYHSAGDELAALDHRSLQHMGRQTLAAASTLAQGSPSPIGQRLYTDILGQRLVSLPQMIGLTLFGLTALALAVIGWRRRAWGRPLAVMAAAIVGGTLLAWLGELTLGALRGGEYWRATPLALHMTVYAGVLLCGVASLAIVGRNVAQARLRIAAWLLFLLVGLAVIAIAPGAAIYFVGPPILVLTGLLFARWRPVAERIGVSGAMIVAGITFLPLLALIEMLLVGGPAWALAPLATLVMMPILIEARGDDGPVGTPAMALAGGVLVIAWMIAALVPAYSADRQQRFAIEYVWDTGAQRGQWAVYNDGKPLSADFGGIAGWTRGKLPVLGSRRWIAAAPALPVAPPAITVLSQSREAGKRRVQIRLAANQADRIMLIARAPGSIIAAGTSGSAQALTGKHDPSTRDTIACQGRSCDGAILDLVLSGTAPVAFDLVGVHFRLSGGAAPLVRARPANARPQYAPDSSYAIAPLSF